MILQNINDKEYSQELPVLVTQLFSRYEHAEACVWTTSRPDSHACAPYLHGAGEGVGVSFHQLLTRHRLRIRRARDLRETTHSCKGCWETHTAQLLLYFEYQSSQELGLGLFTKKQVANP